MNEIRDQDCPEGGEEKSEHKMEHEESSKQGEDREGTGGELHTFSNYDIEELWKDINDETKFETKFSVSPEDYETRWNIEFRRKVEQRDRESLDRKKQKRDGEEGFFSHRRSHTSALEKMIEILREIVHLQGENIKFLLNLIQKLTVKNNKEEETDK